MILTRFMLVFMKIGFFLHFLLRYRRVKTLNILVFLIKGDVYPMAYMTKMTSVEQLNSALGATNNQPLLLFKHSTRCPISSRAYQEMDHYLQNQPNENVDYGIVYVVEDRPVSNETEAILGVKHESPQAILVQNGKAVWHTSHSNITSTALTSVLSGY